MRRLVWDATGVIVAVKLENIPPEEYARVVLPDSFELWGDKRSFSKYAADFRDMAGSRYGKRRPFTVGLRAGGEVVCSCKNYERELRWKGNSLHATGIGAVFTPPSQRGRGYATAMLGALLDAERDAGRDLAFLYSDIHPLFYERLGFVALPSRAFTLRAEALDGSRPYATALEEADWPGIRRCFEALDRRRPWSLRRTPQVWNWMRQRWNAPASEHQQSVALVARSGRSVIAYALGRRVLREDTFVVDDFAFAREEGRARLPALLRAAAGDLRRVGGWLPPAGAREALPRGTVRRRKDALFMVVPLSPAARSWWAENKAETLAAHYDPTSSADHI